MAVMKASTTKWYRFEGIVEEEYSDTGGKDYILSDTEFPSDERVEFDMDDLRWLLGKYVGKKVILTLDIDDEEELYES